MRLGSYSRFEENVFERLYNYWSYKLNEITEIIINTIPSYKIDHFPERYNEALLKETE